MPDGIIPSPEFFKEIQRSVRTTQRMRPQPKLGRETGPRFSPYDVQFGKPTAAIDARSSSDVFGYGDVTVWDTNEDGEFVATEDVVKVYNWTGGKVRADGFIRFAYFGNGLAMFLPVEDLATECKGVLKGAYSSGGSSITVDGVLPVNGTSPVESPSDELTVEIYEDNWPDMDDNTKVRFRWNSVAAQWELIQADCGA